MQQTEVLQRLKDYIAEHILEGKGADLDEQTPLLEWGILTSFQMIRLLNFIQAQFKVKIPAEKLDAQNFADLAAITTMVMDTSV